METYNVLEIFNSYQGEGILLGKKATFIRFSGCNLSCPWCDTVLSDSAEVFDEDILVSKVTNSLVVLTGGEPSLYNLASLAVRLHIRGSIVAIETNGTNPIALEVDWIACSPKRENSFCVHPQIINRVSEFKYVVDADFDEKCIISTPIRVWLQPEFFNFDESVKKIDSILSKPNTPANWRFGIQAHKYWKVR